MKTETHETDWQQTLDALDSVAKGKVIDSSEVHEWLKSWGTDKEHEAPKVNEQIRRL